jgi:hypothetical protein
MWTPNKSPHGVPKLLPVPVKETINETKKVTTQTKKVPFDRGKKRK